MSDTPPTFIELSKTDWRDILFRLKKGESTVVIGPGAITDEEGITLYDKLCQLLEKELDKSTKNRKYRLFSLAESLRRQRAGESILIENAEKVYKHSYIDDSMRQLARIPFSLFISTSGDNMLRNAFEDQAIPYHFGFYNYNSSPGKIEPPSVEKPLIYNLFGSIDEDDSLIFTHDNLYEFLFAILGKKQLPIEIRDVLRKSRNFIFLGFDFEEWYLQIILRLFEIHNEKNSYAYAWHDLNDETLSFYNSEFKLDFINGQIPAFINQLYEKCDEEGLLRARNEAPPITEKLKKQISQGDIAAAIDQMDEFLSEKDEDDLLNQVFMLSGRYNRLMTKQRKGTISDQDADVETNQITAALLEVVSEMEDL